MAGQLSNEPMMDMFIFETSQLLEQLETAILQCEKSRCYSQDAINEKFRIMHTIKGSSAMMLFNNISILAHSIEDLFYFIREQQPHNIDCTSLSDLVLESVDFVKVEIEKIKNNDEAGGDSSSLIANIKEYLTNLKKVNNKTEDIEIPSEVKPRYFVSHAKNDKTEYKNIYKAVIFFKDGCEMENVRAYTIIRGLRELTEEVFFLPEDIIENDDTALIIREKGFTVYMKSDIPYNQIYDFFMKTIFLNDLKLDLLDNDNEFRHMQESRTLNPDFNKEQEINRGK
jgi:two-component system chemotaxis sensor kinase CheA